MTTTSPTAALRKITALRDLARNAGSPAEADTALAFARKLCAKHSVDLSILDAPTVQTKKPIIDGQAPQTKKYSCRWGCGMFVQHTIEELNACAKKAREANGGNAYAAPKAKSPFDAPTSSSRRSTYDEPKARARTNGSHANCSHEATKAARAECRKRRQADGF